MMHSFVYDTAFLHQGPCNPQPTELLSAFLFISFVSSIDAVYLSVMHCTHFCWFSTAAWSPVSHGSQWETLLNPESGCTRSAGCKSLNDSSAPNEHLKYLMLHMSTLSQCHSLTRSPPVKRRNMGWFRLWGWRSGHQWQSEILSRMTGRGCGRLWRTNPLDLR